MGNKQQGKPRPGERVELRRQRSFNPNSDRKKRASSLLQSQVSAFDSIPQSKTTANFGLSPNQMVVSQNIPNMPQYQTFTENKVVSQSVSPMNRLNLQNNQPYTPNSFGQDNMLGLTPRTFQRANDLDRSNNITNYYNNLNMSTQLNKQGVNQNANQSSMIDKSQVHQGANTLILNKYYNGQYQKNRSNIVLNKHFDGELIDQSVLNNISQNHLNRTLPKIDTSFNNTTLKEQSGKKQRPPMSERILSRRYSDNSIATFQQQLETFTRRSIRSRRRREKKYEHQDEILFSMEFCADYKLCTNLFQGTSQSLAQPSLIAYNQDLLFPFNPNDRNSRQPSQKEQELQIYLQFVNDTENSAISHIDFVQLAKEKKEDEELQLMQYLRDQQKATKLAEGNKSGGVQKQKYLQKQQLQNYLGSRNELPNREFADMIEQQFRKETLKQSQKQANSNANANTNTNSNANPPNSSKSQTNLKQENFYDNPFQQNNSRSLTPSAVSSLTPNSKNLHQIQMQFFEDQTKKYKETMVKQNEVPQINKQQNQEQNYGKQQGQGGYYNPKQVVETLGKDEQEDAIITEEEWNNLVDPSFKNPQAVQNQNQKKSNQREEQKMDDSDDDDEKYVQVDFQNKQQNPANSGNPFPKNVINNKNGFSNMSSIVMNNSQSEINQQQANNSNKQGQKNTNNMHIQQNSISSNKQFQNNNAIVKQQPQQQANNNQMNELFQVAMRTNLQGSGLVPVKSDKELKPNKIIGLDQLSEGYDVFTALDQFQEVQSQGGQPSLSSKQHTQQSQQSQYNSAMKESQISVVSDEEKMLHFQNKLVQQQHNNSIQHNQNSQQKFKQQPTTTSHYLPNFQFNHLPANAKGTITTDHFSSKQNTSGIGSQMNAKKQQQQSQYQNSEFETTGSNQHLNSNRQFNPHRLSPGNEQSVNESLYEDVHKLEEEDHMRRLALRKAEEEYDEEIRKKEIEMMLLDKRIEHQKESNFQSHRNKQFRMEELANKHYNELKKQQEISDRANNIFSNSSLSKEQQEGFIKRYQNTSMNAANSKGNVGNSYLNTTNGNTNFNITSGQFSSPQSKQMNSQQNSNDKYKNSYMNSNQYSNQHKKRRDLQVDSYKQTLFQRQPTGNSKFDKLDSSDKKSESIFNSNYYKDNEQQLVNLIMTNNIYRREDQENRQKNLQDYYQQKSNLQQQMKEKEKQNKLLQQQQQQQEQQQIQQQQLKRLQSEESQQHHHHGEGINDLDMFQDFDEAESQHQDNDDHHYVRSDDRLSENEEEYAEDSDDSMNNYNNANQPIKVTMDLNAFKKNRRRTSSEQNSDDEDHKSEQSPQKNETEAIPIQIDIKEFMKKKSDAQQNMTQNLVQDVKDGLKKVGGSQNVKSNQQLDLKRKGSDNSPMSGRGSLPGFADRQNSESEGESMLKSITQQVMRLKGKIERDKKDLDKSNIDYQSKIASKVINTLNTSKEGVNNEDINSNHLLPSSSHKILTQVSSQKNIPHSSQDLNNQQQDQSMNHVHSKSSSSIIQNQQKQQLQQQQVPQYGLQQQQQSPYNPPILININPVAISPSASSSRSHQNQINMQESKLSQRSYNNTNNVSHNQTPKSIVSNNNNKGYQQEIQQNNQLNIFPNNFKGNSLNPPFQINKAVSEYDYESQSQFSSIPVDDKNMNQNNIIKTLYVDQQQYAPSPTDQKLGFDAAMAKRQNQLYPITSIFEPSEHASSNNNKRPSQSSVTISQQLKDRRQSTNSQLSHQSGLSSLTGKGGENAQQTPRSAQNLYNQQVSHVSSQKSIAQNTKPDQQQSYTFHPNDQDANYQKRTSEQDQYFENQPAQFQQFSSPLIDQSIQRRPSNNKPRSSKYASNMNSDNNTQNFFFEMPEDNYGNDTNNNQFQLDQQNEPQIKKQSSGYSYHSNSFYAQNSKKSSIQHNMNQGGTPTERISNTGIDFFNFPSQGQISSHPQGGATSSKSSVAGYDKKNSIQSHQYQLDQASRKSSKQHQDFFEYPRQSNPNQQQERNSYFFEDKHQFNKQNPSSHRSSGAHALFNSNQQHNLHQYESNVYVNQNDSDDDPYKVIGGGDDQNGGFDLDAFGDDNQDNSHHQDYEEPTNIKIDLNNYKRK